METQKEIMKISAIASKVGMNQSILMQNESFGEIVQEDGAAFAPVPEAAETNLTEIDAATVGGGGGVVFGTGTVVVGLA